jgi:hypothetical protein
MRNLSFLPSLNELPVQTWARYDLFYGFDDDLVDRMERMLSAPSAIEKAARDAVKKRLIQNPSYVPIETGRMFLLNGGDADCGMVLCALLLHVKDLCASPGRVDARSLSEMISQKQSITRKMVEYPVSQLATRDTDLLVIQNVDSFLHDRAKDKLSSVISARLNKPLITILECADIDTTLEEFGMLNSGFNSRFVTKWP